MAEVRPARDILPIADPEAEDMIRLARMAERVADGARLFTRSVVVLTVPSSEPTSNGTESKMNPSQWNVLSRRRQRHAVQVSRAAEPVVL